MRYWLTIGLCFSLVATFGCNQKHDDAHDAHKTSLDTLPVFRTVEPFIGTDQDEQPFSTEALRGQVWIASFFFARCESICPALNSVQSKLQNEFSANVRFVSITSDPENDTPEVMKEYASRFGAQASVWKFVTMPYGSMLEVASTSLGLVAPSTPDVHSTRMVLIDSSMNVRGYYDSADTADISRLRAVLGELH